jgi:hypothetical protein
MARKKTADLSPSLVACKGGATPIHDADASPKAEAAPESKASYPLNFKVTVEFRRRFRMLAAEADLKLNELLVQALDTWEEKHRK